MRFLYLNLIYYNACFVFPFQHWVCSQELLRHFWSSYPVTTHSLFNKVNIECDWRKIFKCWFLCMISYLILHHQHLISCVWDTNLHSIIFIFWRIACNYFDPAHLLSSQFYQNFVWLYINYCSWSNQGCGFDTRKVHDMVVNSMSCIYDELY
jgi:hypothetical protein